MDWIIYAFAIGVIILSIFFPSLRPERLSFLPKPRMNVTRCISLHNEIVRLGYEGMDRSPQDFHAQTWFEYHGPAAQKGRRKLSSDLVAFLQGAYEIPVMDGHLHYFHYYATGLMVPGDHMFAFLDEICGMSSKLASTYNEYFGRLPTGQVGRYVRLYYANNLASHPEGLIFDQETNKAIMCMSIWDSDGLCTPDRITWYPLEDILSSWLDMIRRGKVKAVGPDTEYAPWELVSYTNDQVNEAAQVFEELISAIETRMPQQDSNPNTEFTSLIDQKTLEAADIPRGFAFDFLTRARRPHFRFIAPGLPLPTPDTIASQPFVRLRDTIPEKHREYHRSPPVLLFRFSVSENSLSNSLSSSELKNEDPFGHFYNQATYPAGLYFHACHQSNNDHDDAVSLVLPYPIGSNGWARKGDGTLFGENVNDELPNSAGRFTELYQTGRQPFIEMHAVRLVQVFRSWLAMVENGDWRVGEEGIVNGILEWKKADTRGGWENYFIPPEW